ncbi:MAG: O-antigen ligase family protein [Rhodospirillales bacterium]
MAFGFWALVGLVVLAPLPFGSVEPWAWSALATAVGVLLVAWAATVAIGRNPPPASVRRVWVPVALFIPPVLWTLVQVSPDVPAAWQHPIWQTAGRVLGADLVGSITLDRHQTGSALLRLLAYAGIFWLSLQHCRRVQNAHRVLYAVVAAGVLYAAYGLAIQFTGAEKILWYDKLRFVDSVTATFYYKNSFATFAGLGLVAALGIVLVSITETTGAGYGRRETARVLMSRLIARDWIAICALIVVSTALLLSNSRAGFLATCLGLLVLLVATRVAQRKAARGSRAAGVAVALAMAGFVAVSGGNVLDRIGDVTQDIAQTATVKDDRPIIYGLTAQAIEDSPILGTGYGTFPDVFRFYRVPELHRWVIQAHNTYLENALELGVPAAALLVLAVASLGILCAIGIFRRNRDTVYPCIGLAATVLVGTHALVDFTMQSPAVAATYFLIMGAACAQSWSRPSRSSGSGRRAARQSDETAGDFAPALAAAPRDLALEGGERLR